MGEITVVFDVNQTLSDLTPMAQTFADLGAPPDLWRLWFACVLREGFALTASGGFATFLEIGREQGAGMLGPYVEHPRTVVDRVLDSFSRLELHPDVVPGVRALHDAGHQLVAFSNGGTSNAERLLERGGVRDAFSHVLSVDDARAWKPSHRAYAYAAHAAATDLAACVMVAVHPWDTDGAKRAGMRAAWVDRDDERYPSYAMAPDWVIPGIDALAPALGKGYAVPR